MSLGSQLSANLNELTPWVAALVICGMIVGVAITTAIKMVPSLKQAETDAAKVKAEGDASLRADLMKMIGELSGKLDAAEKRNEQQSRECDERIERMEARHSAQVALVQGEMQVHRHERGNLQQAFDMLIALLEQDPTKVRETIARIKEMRARQDQTISFEKGAMAGAKVNGT